MLKTRVITALVLLALLLPSMFLLPPAGWALLVAAFIGIGAWEWGALMGWPSVARLALGAAVAALCAGVSLLDPGAVGAGGAVGLDRPWVRAAYATATVFWGLLVPLWLNRKWTLPGGAAGLLVGMVVLFPAWLALVQLRTPGPGVLLAVLAVVWMADIAAYFS